MQFRTEGTSGVSAAKRLVLKRATSLAAHRQRFDEIVKKNIGDMTMIMEGLAGDQLMKESRRGQEDMAAEMLMTEFAHAMQRRLDRFVSETVQSNWSVIDSNKDGSLDKKELRKVVDTIFQSLKSSLEAMVHEAMQPAIQDLYEWVHSNAMGPIDFGHGSGGMHLAMEANTQARIQQASVKLTSLFSKIIEGLIQSSADISDELFDTLDANKDGKVTPTEFSSGFSEAITPVLDFKRIALLLTQELVRSRSSLRRSQTNLLPADSELGTFLWGVGFAVAMGALAYQARHFVLDRRH
eukprot:TRINITY_DN75693_c0_g1_i1.p1 TRINITY_DN75693_c0_g1~~TRINITY_DN75693_c0_g1_i1.p1  ORF type:complete len:296 (+),score=57.42 TRINITY_DN75693_c0_g1_i1:51-938(+)